MSLTQAGACLESWWCWPGGGGCCCFYPRYPISLCPPDGYLLECSVTMLFLDRAAWNTPTGASLRINTVRSQTVTSNPSSAQPRLCSFTGWERQVPVISCCLLHKNVCIQTTRRLFCVVEASGTWSSWDVSWRPRGRTEVRRVVSDKSDQGQFWCRLTNFRDIYHRFSLNWNNRC